VHSRGPILAAGQKREQKLRNQARNGLATGTHSLERSLELSVAAHRDDMVELALICAPLLLAGLVQLFCLLLCLGHVDDIPLRLW